MFVRINMKTMSLSPWKPLFIEVIWTAGFKEIQFSGDLLQQNRCYFDGKTLTSLKKKQKRKGLSDHYKPFYSQK